MAEQLLEPDKYHGAFSGFGVTVGLAISRSGALKASARTRTVRSTASDATA
jgi:hypothetical protein